MNNLTAVAYKTLVSQKFNDHERTIDQKRINWEKDFGNEISMKAFLKCLQRIYLTTNSAKT